jgi:peptidoglycan/LPS O-acetylase OafA/YrhL
MIDLLKVVAAQLIVLHHVSAYAPFAQASGLAWQGLMTWLFDYGRMAVQVFLVIAGFLAAKAMSRWQDASVAALIRDRYVRLAPLFFLALVLTTLAVAASRRWIAGGWLPDSPTLVQFLAHMLMIQEWLSIPALSAGVWYVAIDFQLYASVAVLLFLAKTLSLGVAGHRAVLFLLAVASMFFFNRDAAYDPFPVYFFAAYALGLFAAWCQERYMGAAMLVLLAIGLASLVVDFRLRLGLAMLIALALAFFGGKPLPLRLGARLQRLSHASYGVFLFHFAVIVVASAIWSAAGLSSAAAALLWTIAVLLVSNWVGVFMSEQIERRLRRLFS